MNVAKSQSCKNSKLFLPFALSKLCYLKSKRQLLNCGFVFDDKTFWRKKTFLVDFFQIFLKKHFILTLVRDKKRSKLDINLDKTLNLFCSVIKKAIKFGMRPPLINVPSPETH